MQSSFQEIVPFAQNCIGGLLLDSFVEKIGQKVWTRFKYNFFAVLQATLKLFFNKNFCQVSPRKLFLDSVSLKF